MFGVILVREVQSLIRRPSALALLLAPLALFSTLIVVRWPSDNQVDLAGERSMQVFRLFALAVAGAVLLLAPAYPATAIVSERRRGTLALLLNTPLSGRAIYLGKLAAALGYTLLPVWMSLPVAAACYALGSIQFGDQVVVLYALFALLALEVSAVALAISCRAPSAVAAMRWTYAAVLLLAFVAVIPTWAAHRSGGDNLPVRWLRNLSPFPAVMETVGQGDWLGGGQVAARGEPLRYAALSLLISAALAIFAIRQIKQSMLDRSRPTGNITDERSLAVQRRRKLMYLIDPQRRSKGIADWINPVFAKEFRSRRFGRGPWVVRSVALCALVSLAATLGAAAGAVSWKTEAIGGVMVQLQAALILIVGPSLASGLISDEIESGSWALLRMTPLTVGQILRGKIFSVSWTALLLLLATLPGYAVIMIIKPVLTSQVLTVLLTLLLTAAFVIVLSMTLSSFFRHTARATIAAYGALITLFGGSLAVWGARDAPFGPRIVERVLVANPAAAAMSVIEAPGFETYHLVPASWYFVGATTIVCLAVLTWRTTTLARPD